MNNTHLFSISFAFPSSRMSSKAAGAVGWAVAAVWLTAAAVPSHELVDSNVRRSVEGWLMATAMMAARMMRARPAVGLGEGERMRVFLLLNLSKGRRYGVVCAAVRHGGKKWIARSEGGRRREWRGSDFWMILVRRLIDLDWFEFLLKPVCLQHRSILKKNQHYWKIFEFFSVVDDFFFKKCLLCSRSGTLNSW
jgi:hypothetical protein